MSPANADNRHHHFSNSKILAGKDNAMSIKISQNKDFDGEIIPERWRLPDIIAEVQRRYRAAGLVRFQLTVPLFPVQVPA